MSRRMMPGNHRIQNSISDSMADQVEPSPKRQKTQACLRCRKRKQKCDNRRPCDNCARSSENCVEPPPPAYLESHFTMPFAGYTSVDPLAHLADIASLEERITRLERNANAVPSPTSEQTDVVSSRVDNNGSVGVQFDPNLDAINRAVPSIGLLSTFASCSDDNAIQPPGRHEREVTGYDNFLSDSGGDLGDTAKQTLWNTYKEKVHCRYPFLRLEQLRDLVGRPQDMSSAFFVNLIYSIGLTLVEKSPLNLLSQDRHMDHYRLGVTRYLSHVFAQPDRILHIQAYLILAMHAMYSPSTDKIISIASVTMRYCVMAQLHCAAAEPDATDSAAKVAVQMRRRVFWSAYALDRTVGAMFDLPLSIHDSQITTKMYANISDSDLDEQCGKAWPQDPPSMPGFTDISAALHVVYCRQIQSEILNTTLHRDFSRYLDKHHRWRLKVLEKLDRWRSLCHRYTTLHSVSFSNSEWLHMIYNYSLAMLYVPTKITVLEEAGEWALKACTQACLIFRKFQREKPTAELWLGLIAQFKCGVTILYCFFATPPALRSQAYRVPEAFEAVRACSITLALLAERWPQSKCMRDTFDILAREIPLHEQALPSANGMTDLRLRKEAADSLLAMLPQLESVVINRNTLRMLREMVTESFFFQNSSDTNNPNSGPDEPAVEANDDSYSWHTGLTEDFFQPCTPHYTQLDLRDAYQDEYAGTNIGFPGDFNIDFTL